jgi:hypothetical protein
VAGEATAADVAISETLPDEIDIVGPLADGGAADHRGAGGSAGLAQAMRASIPRRPPMRWTASI